MSALRAQYAYIPRTGLTFHAQAKTVWIMTAWYCETGKILHALMRCALRPRLTTDRAQTNARSGKWLRDCSGCHIDEYPFEGTGYGEQSAKKVLVLVREAGGIGAKVPLSSSIDPRPIARPSSVKIRPYSRCKRQFAPEWDARGGGRFDDAHADVIFFMHRR
jgi:hypothetical protein